MSQFSMSKSSTSEIRRLNILEISIAWDGPFSPKEVIARLNDGGVPPKYDGEDYGLY